MQTTLKLYYAPGVCSLSPHIVLKESGLPFEAVKTDIRNKTTDGGGDYRKTNPLGYVPALELDDGTILTEGPAIDQYIAERVGAGHGNLAVHGNSQAGPGIFRMAGRRFCRREQGIVSPRCVCCRSLTGLARPESG